jgi:VWFA-related protein
VRAPIARLAPLLALLVPLAPAPIPAQEGRFGETTSVVVVEVPVQVTRDGKPVRGLTAEHFEVLDGKTKQRITGFEVIDLAALGVAGTAAAGSQPPPPAPALPLAARRHFLFLFDLTFAQPKSILLARRAARELLRTGLHPTDFAAVATYGASRGAELVLGFTADHAQVEAAIDGLGMPQLLDRFADPLRLLIADIQAEARHEGGGTGALPPDLPREALEDTGLSHFESIHRMAEANYRRTPEQQITAATSALVELAQRLAVVDGRKYVVYLSEGFQGSAITGQGIDAASGALVADGSVWEVDSGKLYGSARVQADLAQMLETFRRADCVIQAVDVGGVRTAGPEAATELRTDADVADTGRDSLLTMAHYTGGELYERFNDLAAAMGKMLDGTSVTYLLSFQPDGLAHDGAFHEIEVRLKGGPRGAKVHHRAGYFAPDPRRPPDPLEQRLRTAAAILGGDEGGSLPVAALAVPLPSGPLPLLLEVDGPALLAGHAGGPLALEIYAYALDARQAVRGYLTQRVELDLAQVEAALRAGGLKFYGELALPPGAYTVRLLVRAAGGADVLRSLPVEVPAAGAGPMVSPPLFPAAEAGWLVARQAERPGEAAREYPFTLAGRPFVPEARPVVAAAGEARVALLAYNLGSAAVARAEVLRATDGRPAAGGGFRLVDRQRGEGGAPDRLVGVLTAHGLPPGEYLLRVTVTDRASGATHSSSAPFVVKG